MAREAKAAAVSAKQAIDEKTKPAAAVGKKKLLANLQAMAEPVKDSAKEFSLWKSSLEQGRHFEEYSTTSDSSSASVISTMSSEFNGKSKYRNHINFTNSSLNLSSLNPVTVGIRKEMKIYSLG